MQKWEYRIEIFMLRERVRRLAELGEEGWELVSVFTESGSTHYAFKRPLN
jgi:hypothetical protein